MMLINGKTTTLIDAHDRGLSYGDGLFETMVCVDNQFPLWRYHIERLKRGCHRLKIPLPDIDLLEAECKKLSCDLGVMKCIIKIIITRGDGNRGYRPGTQQGTRIISAYHWPDNVPKYNSGITVRWCQTRLGCAPLLAGIKHLNRLEQVLASSEWDDPEIYEGLMLDQSNNVIEGTRTNFFIVKNDRLHTSEIDSCGVDGIIRQLICRDIVKHGLPVLIGNLSMKDVINADELLLCNSIVGLLPVNNIIDDVYPATYPSRTVSHRINRLLRELMLD